MRKILGIISFIILVGVLFLLYKTFSTNIAPVDNNALQDGKIAPERNTKIAFIGDSGIGTGFKQVLDLISNEEADSVVHLGDFDYAQNPNAFNSVINEKLGEAYPYLVVAGNHDRSVWKENCNSDKGCYSELFAQRYSSIGIPLTLEMLNADMYKLDFQGVQLLFIGPGGSNKGPEYAQYLQSVFDENDNLWKVCNWHFNQNKLQLGEKADQTGWEIYDACLNAGAIIATAHEHSYHRTKTLTDFHSSEFPQVNQSYQDPNDLYVYPGSTFVFVSGLGGRSVRNQDRCLPKDYPYGCNHEWAKIYTSNQQATHGALFIEFNYDGDPGKARGYFKNINNEVIDSFNITLKTVDTTPDTSPYYSPTPSLTVTPNQSVTPTPTGLVNSPTPTAQISPTPSIVVVSSNTPTPPISGNICGKSDINGDGVFTIADFAEFAIKYGQGKNTCADKDVDYGPCGGRDANRDGVLNIADFGAAGIGFAQRYYPRTTCAFN